MLLSNLLQNLNDKENTHQSFLQTFNSTGLKSDTATNALYQYLKNKHMNKELPT